MERGRFKNLLEKLKNAVDDALSNISHITLVDIFSARNTIENFISNVGWDRSNAGHIATLVSFAGDMIEQSDSTIPPKISMLLADIIDYFDKANNLPEECYELGADASRVWMELNSQITLVLEKK